MKFLLLLSLLAFSTQLHAGASNATLSCQATNAGGSGIALEGEIPGDFAEFNLTLSSRNGTLKYSDADGTATTVIAFSQGVFTLALQLHNGVELVLYAIPKTVKAKGGDARLVEANFDALLMRAPRPGFDPKATLDAYVRNVPMRCQFQHSV